MLSIQTIVHPTDFSEHSDYAFRLACSLARDQRARLVVLHVAPSFVVSSGQLLTPIQTEFRVDQLWKDLHGIRAEDPEVRLEHRLAKGDPATEILRVAQEIHCDLLVLGTHERTGLGRLLMGSVAEQVVRKAPCTVLTVKTLPGIPAKSGAHSGGTGDAVKPVSVACAGRSDPPLGRTVPGNAFQRL
jgi:nucleotide-binding universal stress UspA family protein